MPASITAACSTIEVEHAVFALLTDAWRSHGWPQGFFFKAVPELIVIPSMLVLACVDGTWFFGEWAPDDAGPRLIEPYRAVRLVGHITHLYAALPCSPLVQI